MRNHINILHLSSAFLVLFYSNAFGGVSVTVDRSGGTMCRTAPIKTIQSKIIYHRTYVPANQERAFTPRYTTYYAPRPTSTVRIKVSKRKPSRDFTGKNGKVIKGYLVSIHSVSKTAKIKSTKGSTYTIPIQNFCSSDIQYMKSWWSNR